MKKVLKVLACLLVAMTVALGTYVPKASAEMPVICDKSANPRCFATLEPGESMQIPLPGYELKDVQIEFAGGPIPAIFPPPTVSYELNAGFTQVSGTLEPSATAKYEFDPATPGLGEVRNDDRAAVSFPLPLTVEWKNISSE